LLQEAWNLADDLDSNHARWVVQEVARRHGIEAEFRDPALNEPNNRLREQLAEARSQPSAEKPAVLPDAVEALAETLARWEVWILSKGDPDYEDTELLAAYNEARDALTRTDQPAQEVETLKAGLAESIATTRDSLADTGRAITEIEQLRAALNTVSAYVLAATWPKGTPMEEHRQEAIAAMDRALTRADQPAQTAEVVTLARQWANCEPGSLPDGIARNRMRGLFGLANRG
jgi:hypothetical protein